MFLKEETEDSQRMCMLSLKETGLARIIFDPEFCSFDGILINANQDVFYVRLYI